MNRESGWLKPLRILATLSSNFYRGVALSFLILGWLGELAIMVARNVVDVEPAWTVVVVTLSLMYGSLLYIGLTTSHISFTLVSRKFNRNPYLARIQPTLCVIIVVGFLYESIHAVVSTYGFGSSSGVQGFNYPSWLVVLVAPIFLAVLGIQFIRRVIKPEVEAIPESELLIEDKEVLEQD
jgi:hypothetical protein